MAQAQDIKVSFATDHEALGHLLQRVRDVIGDAEALGAALHPGGEPGGRARVLHRALAMLWAAHDELESTARNRRRPGQAAVAPLAIDL